MAVSTPETEPGPLGLIAGGGNLPVELVRNAARNGIGEIIAVGFREYTSPEVQAGAAHFEYIGIGQLGKLIRIFTSRGVRRAVMLGSLSPRLTIADVRLDLRMLMLAARVRDRRADSVLSAIAGEMARDGITLVDCTTYLKHLLATDGVMTRATPSKKQWTDIRLGIKLARASGGLDIGQTVVGRKHAVVAVEAMEGTDACIKRAGALAKDIVVVKMSKPEQDFRFDVPCIGLDTVRTLADAHGAVLAVEAGKTFLLDREKTLELADAHHIAVAGVTPGQAEEA